ncbi:nucleotide exchange factor GrpE [Fulvivirga lutea]|uniref:Protein GrpE n=1 Tax=Fulvivirga lutea TaxID=2810512 RepID=A0A975A0T8_9BACT|nr:nucleotide exchange factor GrpE [Fulvivirga lutea]QSE97555.1 nucleotide exchange factor GrpE [Fulvivirga lutea]
MKSENTEEKDTLNEEKVDKQEETVNEVTEQEEVEVEETEEETDELTKIKDELAESKDKYLRLYSEFENFRRRTAKEKLDLVRTANEDLMAALIPVLDDFERAEKSFEKEDVEMKAVKEGIDLVHTKLKKVLEQKGLTPMKGDIGMDFDPDFHEAITQIPAPEKKLKGKVVDIIEKGYMLKEKVVRYAKVVTGN